MSKWDVLMRMGSDFDEKGANDAKKAMGSLKESSEKLGISFRNVKMVVAGMFAAFTVEGALRVVMGEFRDAADLAINLETAMAGVQKTTGLTGAELKGLKNRFIELSTEVPVSAQALSEIGEIAGQLGIAGSQNINAFVETIARGNIALPEFGGNAERLATTSAKLLNLYRLEVPEVENLLSAMNGLANTTAANAEEISRFMLNMTSSDALGITAQQAAALGATFVSLGQDASASSTQFQSAVLFMMQHMDKAAETAGMTSEEFKSLADDDVIGAFMRVIEGLNGIESSSERNVVAAEVFGRIGAKSVNAVAGALPELEENMRRANEEFGKNTSLMSEYNVQAETTAARLQKLSNSWDALKIKMAEVTAEFAPLIDGLAGFLSGGLKASDATKTLTERVIALATGLKELWEGFTLLGWIMKRFTDDAEDAGKTTADTADQMKKAAAEAERSWREAYDSMGDRARDAATAMNEEFSESMAEMNARIAAEARAAMGANDDMSEDFEETWAHEIPATVETGLDDISDLFTDGFGGYEATMHDFGDAARDAAGTAMDGMNDEFSTGFDAMEGEFRDAGGRMGDAFNEGFESHFGWGEEYEESSGSWYSWSGSRWGQHFDPTSGGYDPGRFAPGSQEQSSRPRETAVRAPTRPQTFNNTVNLLVGPGAMQRLVTDAVREAAETGRFS